MNSEQFAPLSPPAALPSPPPSPLFPTGEQQAVAYASWHRAYPLPWARWGQALLLLWCALGLLCLTIALGQQTLARQLRPSAAAEFSAVAPANIDAAWCADGVSAAPEDWRDVQLRAEAQAVSSHDGEPSPWQQRTVEWRVSLRDEAAWLAVGQKIPALLGGVTRCSSCVFVRRNDAHAQLQSATSGVWQVHCRCVNWRAHPALCAKRDKNGDNKQDDKQNDKQDGVVDKAVGL